MQIPEGAWTIAKEVLRHVLRRPVVGIACVAKTPDGRVLLIRRTDTGSWALPGGTLEWGENLRTAARRELLEEAGVEDLELGEVLGVYSLPRRDPRFHAVTIVVHAAIAEPTRPPINPVEISEVRLFARSDLPKRLSHGMTDMLENALTTLDGAQQVVWE